MLGTRRLFLALALFFGLLSMPAALVHQASALTLFYVDPSYTGATRTGSPTKPWQSLSDGVSPSPWSAINTALNTDAVTVYFAARLAGSDADKTTGTQISLDRTNLSTNRLTLDGMSKYNTTSGTTNGNWVDYLPAGTSRFRVTANYPMTTNNNGNPG